VVLGFLRRRRRARWFHAPFPAPWLRVLERKVPLYGRLTPESQAELRGHIQVLLAEKSFEAVGGLELTDEIRVTIAAHAAALLLGRPARYYPGLYSIIVYPSAYRAPVTEHHEGGIVSEGEEERLGESWTQGAIVIAWDAATHGARTPGDGDNVILHEFAHQLDTEDGEADGVPRLETQSDYVAWARVMRPEFERLRDRPSTSALDEYGATDAAEFFAVATEAYFERPQDLREHHPALYEELRRFYRVQVEEGG
jgi:Mlc titration factor MtfA (ptsG expression regulator)